MITKWEDTVPKLPLLVDKLKAMKTEIAYHRLNQCLQDNRIAELQLENEQLKLDNTKVVGYYNIVKDKYNDYIRSCGSYYTFMDLP